MDICSMGNGVRLSDIGGTVGALTSSSCAGLFSSGILVSRPMLFYFSIVAVRLKEDQHRFK